MSRRRLASFATNGVAVGLSDVIDWCRFLRRVNWWPEWRRHAFPAVEAASASPKSKRADQPPPKFIHSFFVIIVVRSERPLFFAKLRGSLSQLSERFIGIARLGVSKSERGSLIRKNCLYLETFKTLFAERFKFIFTWISDVLFKGVLMIFDWRGRSHALDWA